MALVNLKSDLSEFFKKEPSKPTGRFQKPDRDMSTLDVDGKLETYKTPEIKKDSAGNPIIHTSLNAPDQKKRYTDNFESQLVKMKSVDINETHLTGRFEVSPTTVKEPTPTPEKVSDVETEQTNPKGRFEKSEVVIPETDPTGRHTVSGVDPLISTLKGRFETSNIEPVESILNGRHAKTDGAGVEFEPNINDIKIKNTNTFGIQNPNDENPAVYQYGKAVNFDGTLVNINDSDASMFSERAIKAPGALTYSSNLDTTTSNVVSYFQNGSIHNADELTITSTTATNTSVFSNLLADSLTDPGNVGTGATSADPLGWFWSAQQITPLDLPIRTGEIIDISTLQFDTITNQYALDYATIGFTEPDGTTQQSLATALGSINTMIPTYESQIVPTPLSYSIPFDPSNANSVVYGYGYNTVETAVNSGEGQTFTVNATANSPQGPVIVTGMKEGRITGLFNSFANSPDSGLAMVQSFAVDGQDSIVAVPATTITGNKLAFDSLMEDSQTITTTLFGGKMLSQIGALHETGTGITLNDQISLGLFNFEPNMTQTYNPGGEEGSNYSGISEGEFDLTGLNALYSYKTLYEAGFGSTKHLGSANTGTYTPIAYDSNRYLAPSPPNNSSLITFTKNISGPLHNITDDGTGGFKFIDDFKGPKFGVGTGQDRYIHQLGAYGNEEHLRGTDNLSDAQLQRLPNLYNGGIGVTYSILPTGEKVNEFDINFDASKLGVDGYDTYEKFMNRQIMSGVQQKWWGTAFPALSGKLLTASEDGIQVLGQILKSKTKYRLWETHNQFTTEGNQGLHRGLSHYGTLAPNNDINKKNLMAGWVPELNVEAVAPNKTANKYYSVLGYPGLMIASAIADAGAISEFDFRTLVNDGNAQLFGDPGISNYPVRGLFVRGGSYQQGKPGMLRRDYRKPVTTTGPHGGDAITQQQISGVSINKLERQYGDLIKFYIQVPLPNGGSDILRFRSYVTNINDSLGSTWTTTKYIGRPNNMFTYEGAGDRKVSFNLKVAALSRYDVVMMWRKINNLMSLNYPHVDPGSKQMIGPIVGLTLGDWFNNEPGFFDSINITVDASSPWEVNFEDPRHKGSSLGEKAINVFNKGGGLKGGGFGALKDAAIGGLKDAAKNFVTNQELDVKGRQVAQLPHVVDIVISFTSMSTNARTYGGPMFGAWRPDGTWITNKAGYSFPKKSALDILTGKEAGGFAKSFGGKVLRGALGGKI